MREIKFRAWDKENKDMLYFSANWVINTATHQGMAEDYSRAGLLFKATTGEPYYRYTEDGKNGTGYPAILMQFTGLKDKNGKEIYEGDILKHQYKGKGEVIYEAPGFRVVGDDMDVWLGHTDEKKRQIIGNIYENPELLKEEA